MSNKIKEELLRFVMSRKCSVKDYWAGDGHVLGYFNKQNQPVIGLFDDMEKDFIEFLNSNRRNFKIIVEHEVEDTKIKSVLKMSTTEKDKIKLSLEPYN